MQVQYETSAPDHIAKLDRFASTSAVSRRFLGFAYVTICALAWLSAALFYVNQGDQNYGYLGYGALAAILTVSLPRLYRWYQESFWASVLTPESLQGLIGSTVLTVDEESVEEAGPVMTARGAWKDVLRIERGATRTLIFLAPLIAVAVPHEAFSVASERAAFDRFIDDQFEASRPHSTPPAPSDVLRG